MEEGVKKCFKWKGGKANQGLRYSNKLCSNKNTKKRIMGFKGT